MSAWPRAAAVLVLLVALAPTSVAHAQKTPAARADELNDEGKALFKKEDYPGAADRFRKAIVLSPEGRFYFNLCFTLHMQGRNEEALTACDAVENNGADDDLVAKRNKVVELIRKEMSEGGGADGSGKTGTGDSGTGDSGTGDPGTGDPGTGGGTDPGTGDPGAGDPGTGGPGTGGGTTAGGTGPRTGGGQTGKPARMGPEIQTEPQVEHAYNWSLGAEIGALANLGLGDGRFRDSGGHLRGFVDFIVSSENRFGLQGYFDYSRFEPTDDADSANVRPLSVVDLGGAAFQHRPLAGNWYWTPLVGAHLSIQQPDVAEPAFTTVGLRGQVSLDWVFGRRKEHVLTVTPVALNLYLPASDEGSTLPRDQYGLDEGSATYTFTVGYTMRFAEPFGSTPLITLE